MFSKKVLLGVVMFWRVQHLDAMDCGSSNISLYEQRCDAKYILIREFVRVVKLYPDFMPVSKGLDEALVKCCVDLISSENLISDCSRLMKEKQESESDKKFKKAFIEFSFLDRQLYNR